MWQLIHKNIMPINVELVSLEFFIPGPFIVVSFRVFIFCSKNTAHLITITI
jgi:hypothetical protein